MKAPRRYYRLGCDPVSPRCAPERRQEPLGPPAIGSRAV